MDRPTTRVTPRRLGVWLLYIVTTVSGTCAALMPDEDWPLFTILIVGVTTQSTAVVGTLVTIRRPDARIGWILVAIAASISAGLLATQYANLALVEGELAYGTVAAWFQTWLWVPLMPLPILLVLWFPTGRPPSPRWRPVAWIATVGGVLVGVGAAFRPGSFDTFPGVENPLSVAVVADLAASALVVMGPALGLAAVASIVSVFVRRRRATGVERLQMRWFTRAATGSAIVLLLTPVQIFTPEVPSWAWVDALFGFVLPMTVFTMIPLAIGVAVLRYRLYDIDRIVSRTVGYALVTAILAGTFTLLVFALTVPFSDGSDVVVAAATLAVAALFGRVRRRVQAVVDRRFNRVQYDAARTVDTFATRLREEIDLKDIHEDLVRVVSDTFAPQHLSVWLRAPS